VDMKGCGLCAFNVIIEFVRRAGKQLGEKTGCLGLRGILHAGKFLLHTNYIRVKDNAKR
jgi:hypothetical protein